MEKQQTLKNMKAFLVIELPPEAYDYYYENKTYGIDYTVFDDDGNIIANSSDEPLDALPGRMMFDKSDYARGWNDCLETLQIK